MRTRGQLIVRDFRSSSAPLKVAPIETHIKHLIDDLHTYQTEDEINQPAARDYIQSRFELFLKNCGFQFALRDFAELLHEMKGTTRKDGSVPWYHQLIPILTITSKIQDYPDLQEQLINSRSHQIIIRSHLRHDSLEDTGVPSDTFRAQLKFGAETDLEIEDAETVFQNVVLMTKAVLTRNPETGEFVRDEKGKIIKTQLFLNEREYNWNMLNSPHASPTAWMSKQCDGIQNLSSMIGAKPFTPEKRLKYCNEREDRYGARQGMTEAAIRKWPAFRDIIRDLDHMMGVVLYLNFGFLEYVDLAYPNDPGKFKAGERVMPLGIDRYLKRALSIKLPRAFNPIHNLLDRMQKVQREHPDPAVRARAKAYLEQSVCPALELHREQFPKLFASSNDNHPESVVAPAVENI